MEFILAILSVVRKISHVHNLYAQQVHVLVGKIVCMHVLNCFDN